MRYESFESLERALTPLPAMLELGWSEIRTCNLRECKSYLLP